MLSKSLLKQKHRISKQKHAQQSAKPVTFTKAESHTHPNKASAACGDSTQQRVRTEQDKSFKENVQAGRKEISPEPLQKDLALAANILDEIAEERLAKRQRGEESQQLPQEEPDKEQTVNCLMMRESQFEKMKRTKTLLQTYSINGKHLPMEIFIIASIDNGSKSVCVGKCALTI